MADAKALYRRHFADFLANGKFVERANDPEVAKVILNASIVIYAACIIAEAIRNTTEDPDAS